MNDRLDVLVIGAGLFGQVIRAALVREGMSVLCVDAHRPGSGSLPSACLMKPSWFSGMDREYTNPSLQLLDDIYGVQNLTFRVGPVKTDSVLWCDPAAILSGPAQRGTVEELPAGSGPVHLRLPEVSDGTVVELRPRHVVVAAGAWSGQLLPIQGLDGKAGVSVRYHKLRLRDNFIRPWAPYKQLVAFNLPGDRGVWVGDGSAIKVPNWTSERQQLSIDRCHKAVGSPSTRGVATWGVRPYIPKRLLRGRPCLLEEARQGVWVATGGAKNGTVAAGWAAHELARRLS